MNGSLSLRLASVQGRTRPTHLVAIPPLQCSRARYDDPQNPNLTSLTLLHLGGMLQGDQIQLEIMLEPEAHARLTTAAATQVYRMPERTAAQSTTISALPGARLLYLPEPTILFAGSRFSQATHVTLDKGAVVVLRDILVCGRLARGEVHQFERFSSRFEVADSGGRCLFTERALLEPGRYSPAVVGVQGSYPVVGSLYLLALEADVAGLLSRARQVLGTYPHVLAEAGELPNACGLVVRVLGTTAPSVRAVLEPVQRAFTPALPSISATTVSATSIRP